MSTCQVSDHVFACRQMPREPDRPARCWPTGRPDEVVLHPEERRPLQEEQDGTDGAVPPQGSAVGRRPGGRPGTMPKGPPAEPSPPPPGAHSGGAATWCRNRVWPPVYRHTDLKGHLESHGLAIGRSTRLEGAPETRRGGTANPSPTHQRADPPRPPRTGTGSGGPPEPVEAKHGQRAGTPRGRRTSSSSTPWSPRRPIQGTAPHEDRLTDEARRWAREGRTP